MNDTNFGRQRESVISSNSNNESNGESNEGGYETYEAYGRNSLSEGYTTYRETGQAGESETGSCTRNESCCKIARLQNL